VSDDTIIAEWPLNKRGEHLRISIENYNGHDLINIRKWFEAGDGTLHPSKQGVAVQVKNIRQLVDAMTKVLAAAVKRGLVPPDDGVAS
jgi:hypothetical protein